MYYNSSKKSRRPSVDTKAYTFFDTRCRNFTIECSMEHLKSSVHKLFFFRMLFSIPLIALKFVILF